MKLAEGVHWVGVQDWNIRDFHGLYTPKGGSYDAYLILDEKIALIDVVNREFFDELMANISRIIEPEKIDYIIMNHAEPDHSGALPLVMKKAKNVKIITTKKGKDYLYKYHKSLWEPSWEFITVKEGDEISLGKKTLKFIEVPMVHWPESMLTYLIQDKILFSNDLFGTQIADSRIFADEIEDFTDDTKDYFAIVIWPYPIPARNALKKVETLTINIIAPSHGPIWRYPQKIINLYKEWLDAPKKLKVVLAYATMWHSTEKMANKIAEGMKEEGVQFKIFNLAHVPMSRILGEIVDSKALLLGSSTLTNGPLPIVSGFMRLLDMAKPKGRIAATFGAYGWGGGAVKKMMEGLKEVGFELIEPGLEIQFEADEDELKKCIELGKGVANTVKT